MKRILTVLAMLIVGSALLTESTTVGLALPKFRPGKTYCRCVCRGANSFKDLYWEKVNGCAINGKKCTFNDIYTGQKTPGTLDSCGNCEVQSDGGLLCISVRTPDATPITPGSRSLQQ